MLTTKTWCKFQYGSTTLHLSCLNLEQQQTNLTLIRSSSANYKFMTPPIVKLKKKKRIIFGGALWTFHTPTSGKLFGKRTQKNLWQKVLAMFSLPKAQTISSTPCYLSREIGMKLCLCPKSVWLKNEAINFLEMYTHHAFLFGLPYHFWPVFNS